MLINMAMNYNNGDAVLSIRRLDFSKAPVRVSLLEMFQIHRSEFVRYHYNE